MLVTINVNLRNNKLNKIIYFVPHVVSKSQPIILITTRDHRTQCITFAAETNAADTHTG